MDECPDCLHAAALSRLSLISLVALSRIGECSADVIDEDGLFGPERNYCGCRSAFHTTHLSEKSTLFKP